MCHILSERPTILTNSTSGGQEVCNETISIEVYEDGLILGAYFTIVFLVVAGLMQFLGRRWISG